ncbi:ExbD/TolR family protein [Lujinxingia litoralis]|nr:biopolymer transporter ExbD [Lujinxingia litoralis]
MQFESFERESPTINVSALIDVVFILLIFVVLAANFDRVREMDVVLPSAEQTSAPSTDAEVLTLLPTGEMRLGDRSVTRAELFDALKKSRESFEVLVLVGDGEVALKEAVFVFDEAARAGFESVSIATRKAESAD